MVQESVLERVRLHVRHWFAKRMPRTLVFHDLEHTLGVARTARAIGQATSATPDDLVFLEIAALFHDTGYAIAHDGHEEHSADIADEALTKFGVPRSGIDHVRKLIMATKLSNVPRGPLQKILRDADSSKAGQADFIEKSELLRKELGSIHGKPVPEANWLEQNLTYLKSHRFYTAYATKRYTAQKQINIGVLEKRKATPARKREPLPEIHEQYFDRDLSWLSFNDRVLQEAKDPDVPLLERIKFLAIYSNNLDEFYRVRVASLRSLGKLKKTYRAALDVPPEKRVERINAKALAQQKEFGSLFREELLPALERSGIRILQPEGLSAVQKRFVQTYFKEKVSPLIFTAAMRTGNAPFIEDRKLYFACRLRTKGKSKERVVLVNIPSDELGRFIALPATKGRTDMIFLDDAIRVNLGELFTGHKVVASHAIKLSRDAELYLEDEFVGNVKDKVRKSLRKRSTGVPSRFLYDSSMPAATLEALRTLLALTKPDLVPGGRYHNFSDLLQLPLKGYPKLHDPQWPAVPDNISKNGMNTFAALRKGDLFWHFPYHDFGNVVNWLQRAAKDRQVRHIYITLYRVAYGSEVCEALVDALHRGKQVTVFVEVQARFDERSNLFWGEALEKAGATVRYSYAHVKVHCKLCLIERMENRRTVRYAYLGTGNFNEQSSKIYADMAILTRRVAITREVSAVFEHLMDRSNRPALDHLLLAPLSMRSGLEAMVDKEIETALLGRKAEILLKLNSLEDRAMIRKLYDASEAGVTVRLIIRGICCLVPGVKGYSEGVEVISIVDRYLEHTRVFMFHSGGKPKVFLSSADWMGRNLDRRIEVAFPIDDPAIRSAVMDLMEIQWNDSVKARLIDQGQTNPYVLTPKGQKKVRAQKATWRYLQRRAEG